MKIGTLISQPRCSVLERDDNAVPTRVSRQVVKANRTSVSWGRLVASDSRFLVCHLANRGGEIFNRKSLQLRTSIVTYCYFKLL